MTLEGNVTVFADLSSDGDLMPSKPNPFDEIERMFDRMSDQFEALDPTDVAGVFQGSGGSPS